MLHVYSFGLESTSFSRLRQLSYLLLAGSLVVATAPTFGAASAHPAIPGGTAISVRTLDLIESSQAQVGQSYRCTVESNVMVGTTQVVSRGADCVLRIVETKDAGRLNGKSELKLELARIRVDKDLVDITSDPSTVDSAGKGKSTGIKTGIGTAAGAGLGSIFGGRKGALIGAGAGAGAGLATSAVTRGPQIKVAPETVLNFITH